MSSSIAYRNTQVRADAGDKWEVADLLTIRDVTREVRLSVEFCGLNTDPWGKIRAGFALTLVRLTDLSRGRAHNRRRRCPDVRMRAVNACG
jgi:hypothetical protein